jgi:hypothetical protein
VGVAGLVPLVAMLRRALIRMPGVDRDDVLIDVVAVRMMEVAFVQIVGMPLVLDGRMAAAGRVRVRVVSVR